MTAATTFVIAMTAVTAAATFVTFVTFVTAVTATAAFMAFVTAAAAAVATTMAAALAAHVIDHGLDFLVRSLAALHHATLEVELLASQRMVEVQRHLVVSNVDNSCHEALSLLVLKRHDGALEDILFVETAVHHEHLLLKSDDVLVDIRAIGIVLAENEIEVGTLLQVHKSVLESIEGYAEARNELERLCGGSLFNHGVGAIGIYRIQLVRNRNKLVAFLLHFSCFFIVKN